MAHHLEHDRKERRPVIDSIYWFGSVFTIVNVFIAWIADRCICVISRIRCRYVVCHTDEDSDDVVLFSLHFDRQSVSPSRMGYSSA